MSWVWSGQGLAPLESVVLVCVGNHLNPVIILWSLTLWESSFRSPFCLAEVPYVLPDFPVPLHLLKAWSTGPLGETWFMANHRKPVQPCTRNLYRGNIAEACWNRQGQLHCSQVRFYLIVVALQDDAAKFYWFGWKAKHPQDIAARFCSDGGVDAIKDRALETAPVALQAGFGRGDFAQPFCLGFF